MAPFEQDRARPLRLVDPALRMARGLSDIITRLMIWNFAMAPLGSLSAVEVEELELAKLGRMLLAVEHSAQIIPTQQVNLFKSLQLGA